MPKLPNMNEFSPGVVGELGPLLDLVASHPGDRVAISHAIVASYPRIAATLNETERLKRARNIQIGMSQCGLFALDTNQLTEFGRELRTLDADEQYRAFTEHLLNRCDGNEMLDAVRAMQARGDRITLDRLRHELRDRGFQVTTNEGNASKVRQWLERAGAIDGQWTIDEQQLEDILGITNEARQEWQGLLRPQRALLLTLRHVATELGAWIEGRRVKEICVMQFGPDVLPEGSLRATVLNPLVDRGWIETEGERGARGGRGGNLGRLKGTEKLFSITAELQLDVPHHGIPAEVWESANRNLEDLRTDLNGNNTYRKGLALETIAVKLARAVGLIPVSFRLRGNATGGAEVDLLAEGLHLHYSRWLVQCKATESTVSVDVLAREVGMAILLKAHVIVMVTMGRFSGTVRQHADQIERTTALQVVLIDGTLFRRILETDSFALIDILKEQAAEALEVKRRQAQPDTEG